MTLPADGDVVDVLIAQHVALLESLDEVRHTRGAERAGAFARVQAMLTAHERGEQEVVHPVTKGVVDDPEIVAERVLEERQADLSLAELRALNPDSDEFDRRFAAFREAVIAHAGWEERVEFPELRRTQTAEQLRYLANELRAVQAMH
jgi:hemerythrin superfamily protein